MDCKHGATGLRTRQKLHLDIDARTHDLQAVSLTEAGLDDAEEADGLFNATDQVPVMVAADGAYD